MAQRTGFGQPRPAHPCAGAHRHERPLDVRENSGSPSRPDHFTCHPWRNVATLDYLGRYSPSVAGARPHIPTRITCRPWHNP